jgi:hypothetical protein
MSTDAPAGSQDWAIVVGITRYPDLTDLEGSENDARAFYDWVTSAAGGGVPADRARLILSSDYSGPFEEGQAEPTVAAIEKRLNELIRLAGRSKQEGRGLRVGRRLYLYFSGHGCAPSFEEAALLVANATRMIVYHLTGKPTADWFYRTNVFDEVVLVMDCCRERYEKVGTYVPPWVDLTRPDVVDKGRRFYAYATKWSKKAREKVYPPAGGKVRGMFSVALLEGLNGAAYDSAMQRTDPASNKLVADVTANSLRNYLINNTARFFTPAELADDEVGVVPDVVYDEDPAHRFVLATVEVPAYPTTFVVPADATGRVLQILELREDGSMPVFAERPVTADPIVLSLPRRFFAARIEGTGLVKPFSVTAVPGVDHVVRLT